MAVGYNAAVLMSAKEKRSPRFCLALLFLLTACQSPSRNLVADVPSQGRASTLQWTDYMGGIKVNGRERVYSLLASGQFVARMSGVDIAVKTWVQQHPQAEVFGIQNYSANEQEMDYQYAWVADRGEILNIELVRNGCIPCYTLETGETNLPVGRYKEFLALAESAEQEAKQRRVGIWCCFANCLRRDFSNWLRRRWPEETPVERGFLRTG